MRGKFMGSAILAFDLGTTSTKAAVVDPKGNILGTSNYAYETSYPRSTWAEQDPLDWWTGLCKLTPEVLTKSRLSAEEIACVVLSGKMLGLIPVQTNGQPARRHTFIFADARSITEASEFLRDFGHERFYSITGGSQVPAIYPLFKILWLRNHEPEVYEASAKFLQAKTFILHRLTGNYVIDYSDASQTGMFDLKKLDWSKEILDAASMTIDKLPEVRSSIDIAGHVTKEAARETSLGHGTPVVVGGGDVLCACAGAGVVEKGLFYIYVGSAAWCGTVTPSPALDFEARQLCLAHIVPGEYAPHHTMYNGANCEQWIRETVFRPESQAGTSAELYQAIETRVRSVPPGSKNLLFLPYMRGGDPPFFDPSARGAFIGLDMGPDERHMYRSVLEGVAYQLRMILDVFRQQKLSIEQIRLIGGGAESALWRQILADIFQRELIIPDAVREAGCLGAAMAGGVGVGMFRDFSEANGMIRLRETVQPRPEHAEVYNRLYEIFQGAYPALRDSFRKVSTLEESQSVAGSGS
jgi:xylulokinase